LLRYPPRVGGRPPRWHLLPGVISLTEKDSPLPFPIPTADYHPTSPASNRQPYPTEALTSHDSPVTIHYLPCFDILTNSSASYKILTLVFSSTSELFPQNTRGGISSVVSSYQRALRLCVSLSSFFSNTFAKHPHPSPMFLGKDIKTKDLKVEVCERCDSKGFTSESTSGGIYFN
jgi:hypothetical protein